LVSDQYLLKPFNKKSLIETVILLTKEKRRSNTMAIKKILVVDDSPTERHIIGEILTNNGFTVTFAEDGERGGTGKIIKPDLVIMDVVIARFEWLSGDPCNHQRTRDAEYPIILCTTKDQETDRVWGLRQGAKDYVTKPVNAAELLGKCRSG